LQSFDFYKKINYKLNIQLLQNDKLNSTIPWTSFNGNCTPLPFINIEKKLSLNTNDGFSSSAFEAMLNIKK
jgi:hypothetical protein